jgi:alpha-galactosidase
MKPHILTLTALLAFCLAVSATHAADLSDVVFTKSESPDGAWVLPSEPPNDSVMAPPADVAEAAAWTTAVFAGNTSSASSTTNLKLLFSVGQVPFSFNYGGKPSAELLKAWPRKVTTKSLADRVEHTVQWTDEKTGLRVTAVAGCFKRYPAVDWLLYFENHGSADTPIIENIRALDVQLNTQVSQKVILHRIAGDNCSADSFRPMETPLDLGQKIGLAPRGGRSSNGTFPFFNVASGDQGVFAAIGWSGQWSAVLDRAQTGATRVHAGMELTHFVLNPGEKVRSPRIMLMAWRGDRMDAHNRFRRLMLYHYSPKLNGRPVLIPAFLQCYDRYRGHPKWPSEEGQIQQAKAAHDMGCEGSWLDAAWFPGGFPDGVGNWTTHDRFPRGLKPVSEACRGMGMKFMVWFEPERVARGSQISKEHPEFVHGGAGGGLYKLDDPVARRWLTDLLLKRITEYGMDWYRNDFNMDPLGHWRSNDTPDRQGITEIRYIEGLYEMWDEMRAKNPGLVIDNCASGGRRIDLEMHLRSVTLWQSDINCHQGSEDAHQAQNVFLSLYIPLHTPCAWKPDPYELRSVVTAGLVLELPYLDAGFSFEKTRAMVEEVKAYRKFWYGDLYPLTEITPAADRSIAFELFRPDVREGIILCFRRPKCPSEKLSFTLKGLDPAKDYWVWSREGGITPAQKSGRDLMQTGLEVQLRQPRSSDVITFRDAALGKPPIPGASGTAP